MTVKLPRLHRTTLRGIPFIVALLLVVLGPGTARGKGESCATQERLITEPVDFDIESHIIRKMEATGIFQTTFKYDFKDKKLPQELEKTIHDIRDLRVEDGYLKFTSTGNDPHFTLPGLQIAAEEVSVIAIRAAFEAPGGRSHDKLDIYYATAHEPPFREKRKLVTRVKTDGKLRTILLFTGGAPGWEGTITSLRVDPVRSKQDVAIYEIALLKTPKDVNLQTLNLPPTGAARTLIDHKLRNVVFAYLSEPFEWNLTLPCEAEFHAQLALPGIYRHLPRFPFHILVELKDRKGEWMVVSRSSFDESTAKRLFRGVDLRLDLDRWSGQRVTLRMTAVEDEADSSSGGLVYWANPFVSSRRSNPERPNIVLISIDTLRADHLSLYGYPRRTSPHLDAWAKKSVTFNSAISQATWTLPSHASLFTSLYTSQHQAVLSRPGVRSHLSEGFVTLAERLQKAGYITAGFVGGLFVSAEVNMDQGFDLWSEQFEFGRELSQVEAWLDRHASTRFFLFLHTYEVHDYVLKRAMRDIARRRAKAFFPDYQGKVLEENFNFSAHKDGEYNRAKDLTYYDIRFLESMYDGQILAVDKTLGVFLEELSRRGLEGRTIVIVTSDHGEEFNEHGGLHHNHSLYDEMLRVPLIIRYPQGPPEGRTVTQQVRLIDLYPTIMEMAGLPVPEKLEGRSLAPLLRGEAEEKDRIAFSEAPRKLLSGVRSRSGKYIYRRGKRLFFDLVRDPLEQYPDVRPRNLRSLLALHDQFTAKSGGFQLLARGPRMDGCPIRLRTEGRFLNAVPRFMESQDSLNVKDKQRIDMTFNLKDEDVDGLYFLAKPASASVKVEICQKKVNGRGDVKVRFGANGPVKMGSEWSVGKDITHEAVRVSDSPPQGPDDLQADMALWNFETRPAAGDRASEISPEQRDEFLRLMRSLGYLE